MFTRIVVRVVDPQDERDVLVGCRRRDDRLFCAGVKMSTDLSCVGKDAGGLDHHIDAELFPWQAGWILLIQNDDILAVDFEDALTDFDRPRENSIVGVIAEQMRVGFQVRHVVHGDHRQTIFMTLEHGPQNQSADPAEAAYSDSCCHGTSFPVATLKAVSIFQISRRMELAWTMDENRTCDVRAAETYDELQFNSPMGRSQPCETASGFS